ncbi:MAG: GTP-binding protein, partial [Gemmataceae bacterium]|nr:GTP-binding protein [Gemmataceae bacterium]
LQGLAYLVLPIPGGQVAPWLGQLANGTVWGLPQALLWCALCAGAVALLCGSNLGKVGAEVRVDGTAIAPGAARGFHHSHTHSDVNSVGITIPGDLDAKRLNEWMGELLQARGPDIYRMKGVLSIRNDPKRFVFQGVHMLFDGQPGKPWGSEARGNKLVFIGRRLDRAELEAGFRRCLA